MPVVILCMVCLSVVKIFSVKLFSSKPGEPLIHSLFLVGTSADQESLQVSQV